MANSYKTAAARLRRKAAQKRRVAARHAPGTAYHTRAIREAEALEAKAAQMEARGVKR